MKKFPKPWFRTGRGWFLQLGGKQINLGMDEVEAFRRYHEIMAQPEALPPPPQVSGPSVLEIIDKFVTFCWQNKAEETAAWYKKHLKSFLGFLGQKQHMPAPELCPYHVSDWCAAHPNWSPTTKRGRMICVQRAFNWAVKGKRLAASPLAGLEKPAAERRENHVEPEFFAKVLKLLKYQEAIDLLTIVWATGCRPQEIFRIEARHFQGDRWVFPKAESKGKKRQRIVFLTPVARAVCERLVAHWPTGPIFRNSDGHPWNAFSVNCLMVRLSKKTGRKVALVDFRHGVATDLLKSGVDTLTVSILLGHANTDMLSRHYAHVHQDADHLKAAIKKRT